MDMRMKTRRFVMDRCIKVEHARYVGRLTALTDRWDLARRRPPSLDFEPDNRPV